MKKRTILISIGVIVLISGALVYGFREKAQVQEISTTKQTTITLGNTIIRADIADTDESMARGLGGRDGLAPNTGMFFVFETDGPWGIWMKDMKFAIDVVWFDGQGKIVYLVENMEPSSYPKIYTSEKLSRYVLEIPVGTIQKTRIKLGDVIPDIYRR